MRAPLVLIFSGLFLSVSAFISGCGLPGAPQSPSLHIPNPVQDLRAARKGNDVVLTWTAPTQSTDGTLVRRPGKMIISRAVGSEGKFVDIAEMTLQPALDEEKHERVSVTDSLASVLGSSSPKDFVVYRIKTIGERDRTAGPGNAAQVPAAPILRPPTKVDLRLVPKGVEISFTPESSGSTPSRPGLEFAYRVLRRLEGSKTEPVIVAQVPAGAGPLTVVDSKIDWESTYDYWVIPVTHWQSDGKSADVEGDDSPTSKILAHDSFSPMVPSGLQAVYAGDPQKPAIDLTWTPNSDDDLAGYNVYRREGAGGFMRINSGLVKAPSFHDAQVQAEHTLAYAVTAVDVRGNESEKSKETSERVPRE
jgi:hypothetical protein